MDMSDCPCCSGVLYKDCCEPFIERIAKPVAAADVMRARYTAYATGNVDYIKYSASPEIQKEFDEESTRKWSKEAVWNDFEIISTEGGDADSIRGKVEFLAHYTIKDKLCKHHEVAEFIKIDGEWKFLDGDVSGPDPIRRDAPKVGRNDICPCGSDKKYKKCCGKRVVQP